MTELLLYLTGFSMPIGVLLGHAWGGMWTFQTVFGLYVAIPVLDLLVGVEPAGNALAAARPVLQGGRSFRLVSWLWVPLQLSLLVWGAHVAGSGRPTFVEFMGLTVSVGLTTGCVGITFGHELIHRRSRFEQSLAAVLLMSVSYPQFWRRHSW